MFAIGNEHVPKTQRVTLDSQLFRLLALVCGDVEAAADTHFRFHHPLEYPDHCLWFERAFQVFTSLKTSTLIAVQRCRHTLTSLNKVTLQTGAYTHYETTHRCSGTFMVGNPWSPIRFKN